MVTSVLSSDQLSAIHQLLDRIAERQRSDFGNIVSDVKPDGTLITACDRWSDQTIVDGLADIAPGEGVHSEEGSKTVPASRAYWVVDPLDGTTNFLHGLPHWSVSIALEHKGQVVAGVVHDPIKNELFFAEKGSGAWMNENRLRVSGRCRMIEAVFATGLPFAGRADLPASLRDLGRLLPVCAGVRQSGSAALDLSYVAAGRFDGFWERRLNVWDLAAGLIILREAGGLASPIDESLDILGDGQIICSNEPLYETFLAAVRNAA